MLFWQMWSPCPLCDLCMTECIIIVIIIIIPHQSCPLPMPPPPDSRPLDTFQCQFCHNPPPHKPTSGPSGMRGVIICHSACYRWLPHLSSGHRCHALYHWHLKLGVESVLIADADDLSTWSSDGFPTGMPILVLRSCIIGRELNKNGNLC